MALQLKSDLSLFLSGFLITELDTHHSIPLDVLPARRRGLYLYRTTQHMNTETNIHAPRGIRSRDSSNQAAADLRLRHHGDWDP
jgi:hypothetical protein